MENPKSYESAIEELQEIVAAMESGELRVDDLADKVERAAALVSFCRKKLMATDKEVQAVLEDLKGKSNG
jgi:exodeoxyribonuclease VII small subunit